MADKSPLRREVSPRRTSKVSAGRPPSRPLTDGVVTLRLPLPNDVPHFTRYGSDEDLLEGIWIAGPRGRDVRVWAAEFVDELIAGWTAAGGDHGGGLIIDEGEPCVGTVNFLPRAPHVVEMTYGVAPPWRGRGIATRAASLAGAGAWATTEGDFDRVELRIGEEHAASRRVAEKAGYECVERLETYVAGTGLTHVDCVYVRTRVKP